MGEFPSKKGNKKGNIRQWHLVKVDYQTTNLSIKEIAAKHGVTFIALNDKIHRDGWRKELLEVQKATELKLKESGLAWEQEIRTVSKAFMSPIKNILVSTNGEIEPSELLSTVRALKTVDDLSRRSHGLADSIQSLDVKSNGQSLSAGLLQAIESLRSSDAKVIDIPDAVHQRLLNSDVEPDNPA